jgi:hypothetical protein
MFVYEWSAAGVSRRARPRIWCLLEGRKALADGERDAPASDTVSEEGEPIDKLFMTVEAAERLAAPRCRSLQPLAVLSVVQLLTLRQS